MANSKKPRKKHRTGNRILANAAVSGKLPAARQEAMRSSVRMAVMRLYMGTAGRTDTDVLASFLCHGYIIAENFNESDEIRRRLKGAMQKTFLARKALDRGEKACEPDIEEIETMVNCSLDEICDLDMLTIAKLHEHFKKYGQKMVDEAVAELEAAEARKTAAE
ncbi:MAG: hypothetical protein SOX97_10390 [Sutterella sp.]|nr:hypothetical protein [Sutterella sp.]